MDTTDGPSRQMDRIYLAHPGWPVYDLRRRKFGIVHFSESSTLTITAHIEGDRFLKRFRMDDPEFEYPQYYVNDEIEWKSEGGYFIKHVHYHVPKDVWQYTIAKAGIDGFDRFTIDGDSEFQLVKRFISKI